MNKSARRLSAAAVAGVLGLAACSGGGGGSPMAGPTPTPPPSADFSVDPARELRRIGAATKIALDFASLFAPLTAEQLANLAVFGAAASCPGASGGSVTISSLGAGQYALDYNQCDATWAVVDGAIQVGPSDTANQLIHDFDLVWDGLQFAGSVVVEHSDGLIRVVSGGTTLTVQQTSDVFRLVPGVVLRDREDGTYRFEPDAGFTRAPLGTDGGVSISRGFGQTDTAALVTVDKLTSAIWRVNPPLEGDLDYDRLTAGSAHLVEGNVEATGGAIGVTFRVDLEDEPSLSTQGQWSSVLANPLFTIDD